MSDPHLVQPPVADATRTLIFVAVDGVLNVGMRSAKEKPVQLSRDTSASVARLLEDAEALDAGTCDVLNNVMRCQTSDIDSSTYGDRFSRGDIDVCNVFVGRLAHVIQAAGRDSRVILASCWRRPRYLPKVVFLEQIVGSFLGRDFCFDDRTDLSEEGTGGDRLELIGRYVASQTGDASNLRVLVLDDFFQEPLETLCSPGKTVESFLQSCVPETMKVAARTIHTCSTLQLQTGQSVRVGTGLNWHDFREAISFLEPGQLKRSNKRSEARSSPTSGTGKKTETMIFLDIDGVLNVGIQDPDPSKKPLSFNEANVSIAQKLEKCDRRNVTAEILLAVMRSQTQDGDSSTYGNFVSRGDIDICEAFADRLAHIFRAAGNDRRVIISSSWRRCKYVSRIEKLQEIISEHLGQEFVFDDRTSMDDENTGADRLRIIGEYVKERCRNLGAENVRALVLDDFFYLPITGFRYADGTAVNNVQDAQAYLESCAPKKNMLKARIIHTYAKCALQNGASAQVGTGLSLSHFRDAVSFLDQSGVAGVPPSPQSQSHLQAISGGTVDGASDIIHGAGHRDNEETFIFLDIDGVLNVGIQQPGNKEGTTFTEANVSIANKLKQEDGAANILAVMRAQTFDGDSSTYGNFLSRADVDVCDVFVDRLIQIIRTAGVMTRVVLCSNWRRAKYKSKIEMLEEIISGRLKYEFKFDDRTALDDEATGSDRLRLIGKYIREHCSVLESHNSLRVLVLDDFFYLPIRGFLCGGVAVNSLANAEQYLESCALPPARVRARIIHTYASLPCSGGQVNIGTGLSLQHLRKALAFLELGTMPSGAEEKSGPASRIRRAMGMAFGCFGHGHRSSVASQ